MSRTFAGIGTRLWISLGAALLAAIATAEGPLSKPLVKTGVRPKIFGTNDYSVTVVSGLAFSQPLSTFAHEYRVSPSLGRYCDTCTGGAQLYEYYAPLNIPEGVVIDFIGFNTTTDTDGALRVELLKRNNVGVLEELTGFFVPAHGWETDWAGPLDIPVPANVDQEFALRVEQFGHPNPQFFAYVEVWWRRTVSPAPLAATFNDVPTGHPFFQFVEALYDSGITAGCGGGNYCPDNPVTRGQMAVFFAKALGLHWRNCCPN
jgi:S-layer homology domain